MVLAGGLTPENVSEAITRARPFAVDVVTGVEAEPGRKDRAKVEAFIEAVRFKVAKPNAPAPHMTAGEAEDMGVDGEAGEPIR
jgi:N-(5'phosphoribosyl)anthranilate (PRA) isomerase